ncbi:hypothetical protein FACHB389_35260 [Nostoc calcicola FACHB-389]|nr:hypothetical protein FACHB389_35260 [Nostoc calcicola FACHB-389]
MQVTTTRLSEAYHQLAGVFEALEKARFELDKDFGVNALDCSGWYLSPSAVVYLEKRLDPNWSAIKYNQRFRWKTEIWDGFSNKGVSLVLNLQAK